MSTPLSANRCRGKGWSSKIWGCRGHRSGGESHLLRGLPLEGWGIPKLRDEVTGGEGGGCMGVPHRELACVTASWAEDIK